MSKLDALRAHDGEFEKHVYELAPDMYLAVGYAASNVGLIVGDDGLIVIDTTESTKAAENILAEFRKISDKPVTTIIYTHSHRDHISGATVFAEGRAVEIIAHRDFESDLVGASDKPGPGKILMNRTARQFGIGLEQGTERINLGLGPGDRPVEGLGTGYLPPTLRIDTDGTEITRAGKRLHLAFAPGECADNLVIWNAETGVLFSADNFYRSFPNLYAIRGTPYRDFDLWADSLARLARFGASVLAPGHTRPLFGAEVVTDALAQYEAAIRHVVVQCAAGMNQGLTADELVEFVTLPDELADSPYLQEFYGTLAWSVRAYFAGTLGWFDGNPSRLSPLPPKAEARRMADLAGGAEALAQAVLAAAEAGDFQWVLELSDRVLRLDPENTDVHSARIAAMRALADDTMNACARNYCLSAAREAEAQ